MENTGQNIESDVNFQKELKQYYLRNYLAHSIEGGLYMAGLVFVASDTILPPLVKALDGPLWMEALAPILTHIGIALPSIFIIHYLERLYWKKPILMATGFFQRLPMLFAGLSLLFFADKYPLLTLILVGFGPLFSGFFCGLTHPAWVELVAKTIPASKRASVYAIRLIIASFTGLIAGVVIAYVLGEYPGTTGYGILHIIAFIFLTLSYLIFSMIKETNLPMEKNTSKQKLGESLKDMFVVFKNDKALQRFIVCISLGRGVYAAIPFLPSFALAVINGHEKFLGYFVIAAVIGSIPGNIISGYLGDRYGAKIGMYIALVVYLLAVIISIFSINIYMFYLVFFMMGFSKDVLAVSSQTLKVELAKPEMRQRYMSVINIFSLPAILLLPLLGAVVMGVAGSYKFVALFAIVLILIAIAAIAGVEDPRKKKMT